MALCARVLSPSAQRCLGCSHLEKRLAGPGLVGWALSLSSSHSTTGILPLEILPWFLGLMLAELLAAVLSAQHGV